MSKQFILDAAERVAATFVEAAAGVLILGGTLDLSTGKKALTAGVIAAMSVIKSLGAKFLGSADTASLLPVVPVAPPTP